MKVTAMRTTVIAWLAAVFCAGLSLRVGNAAQQCVLPEELRREYSFLNIVFAPMDDESAKQTAADILEYRRRTGCRMVLPSLSFHPSQKDPRVKARSLIEAYKRLKKSLAGSDIELAVLVQSIMGHWADPSAAECKWTRSVDINGKPWRFCPLDPSFREYVNWFITELAKEKPAFILTDDDMLCKGAAECFCDLHLAEANRRLGLSMTAEQYRARVKAAKEGDRSQLKVKAVFDDLATEMTSELGRFIRKAIDSVDPSIPAGICQGAPIYLRTGECAAAIAAAGQPTLARLSTSCYRERSVKDFPRYMLSTFQKESVSRDVDLRLDESDTFPHNLWSVSAVTFKSKLVLSAMSGLTGSKIWFVGMHKGSRPVPKEYLDVVSVMAPFCRALAREVKGTRQKGFVALAHVDDITTSTLSSYLTWGDRFGGVFGIPWRCSPSVDEKNAVYTLADDEDVRRCTDGDLRRLLSGRLLMDGRAAAEMTKRGFSRYMGVKAVSDFKAQGKGKLDTAFDIVNVPERVKGSSLRVMQLVTPKTPRLEEVSPGASVYSVYEKTGAPAAVYYENELGGRIMTAALDLGLESFEPWCRRGYDEDRKEWFLDVLDKLSGGRTEYAVLNNKNMAVMARESPEGHDLVSVWNIHHDPVTDLGLRVARKPSSVDVLDGDGTWKAAQWKHKDGYVNIAVDMQCYHYVILRFRY